MEEAKTTKFNPFKKGWKIKVVPIIKTGWLGTRDHAAAVMFDQTSMNITVPFDKKTGHLKEILTKEEKEFFEAGEYDFQKGELDHRKDERKKFDKNYWKNFNVRLSKPIDGVLREGDPLLTLDLSTETSDYHQYFQYKVLLANSGINGIVAPTWEKRRASGSYKIALVDEEVIDTEITTKYHREKKVTEFISKIDNSPTKLHEFLFICYLEDSSLTEPPSNADIEWYIKEVMKLKDSRPELLLKIIDDAKNYPFRVLIHKGLRAKALVYTRGQGFTSSEGKPFAHTLQAMVDYLKDDRFQEDLVKLEHRVDEFYKKD